MNSRPVNLWFKSLVVVKVNSSLKVLALKEDLHHGQGLATNLRSRGHLVSVVMTPTMALCQLLEEEYDVIISGLNFAECSAFEFVRTIKVTQSLRTSAAGAGGSVGLAGTGGRGGSLFATTGNISIAGPPSSFDGGVGGDQLGVGGLGGNGGTTGGNGGNTGASGTGGNGGFVLVSKMSVAAVTGVLPNAIHLLGLARKRLALHNPNTRHLNWAGAVSR